MRPGAGQFSLWSVVEVRIFSNVVEVRSFSNVVEARRFSPR